MEDERTDDDPDDVVAALRSSSTGRVDRAWERLGRSHADDEPPTAAYRGCVCACWTRSGWPLIAARDAGRYDDEVLRDVLTLLDSEESLLDRLEDTGTEWSASWSARAERAEDCEHLHAAPPSVKPTDPGGLRGVPAGRHPWVHLRLCLTCGHVGCCDSSPEQHADRHYDQTSTR